MESKMIKAISDHIIAKDGNFGPEQSKGGIYVPSTIGKTEGIVPRWFNVVAVGPDDKTGLLPGQWVYVANGRWTEHFKINKVKHWRLDPEGCLLVSDEKPEDTLNLASEQDTAMAFNKTR